TPSRAGGAQPSTSRSAASPSRPTTGISRRTSVAIPPRRSRPSGPRASLASAGPEDHEALAVDEVVLRGDLVPGLGHLAQQHLARGAMTEQAHEPALAAGRVDHRDAAAGWEIAPEVGEVVGPIFEVMVGVDGEHEVDGPVREQRVVEARLDHLDVRDVRLPEALLQIGVHLLVDVDGIDAALRADRASEAQREVAAPRAEVGHALARIDAERLDHALGLRPRSATG